MNFCRLMLVGLLVFSFGTTGCDRDTASPHGVESDESVEFDGSDTDDTTTETERYIDPEAVAITENAVDYLLALDTFSFSASVATDVVQDDGQKIQFSRQVDALLLRPNKLRVERRLDDGSRWFMWYDGSLLTIYDDRPQVYGRIKAPATIDETVDFVENVLDGPQPLADLFHSDRKYLDNEYYSTSYVGRAWLQDVETHHIAFQGEFVDWQLWFASGDQPLIQKFVITYKWLPGEPQMGARLYDWDLAPDNGDDQFDAVLPADAIEADVLILEPIEPETQEAT